MPSSNIKSMNWEKGLVDVKFPFDCPIQICLQNWYFARKDSAFAGNGDLNLQ